MQKNKRQQQKQRKQKQQLEFKNKQNKIKEILNKNGINYHDLHKDDVVDELQQCLKDLKQVSYLVDASLIQQKVNANQIKEIVCKVCSGGGQFINAVKQLQNLPKNQYWLGQMIGRILEKYLECDIAYQSVSNFLDAEIKNNQKYSQLLKDLQILKQIKQDRCGPINVEFSQTGKQSGLQEILKLINNKSSSSIKINSAISMSKKQFADKGVQTQLLQKYIKSTDGSQVIKQKKRQEDKEKIKRQFDQLRKEIANEKQKINKLMNYSNIIENDHFIQQIDLIELQYNKRIIQLEKELHKQKSMVNEDHQRQLKKLRQEKQKQMFDHQKKILQLQNDFKLKEQNMQKLLKTQKKQSTSLGINEEFSFSSEILLGPQLAFWSPLLLGYEVSKYEKPKKVYKQQRNYLLKTLQDYTKKKVKRTKLLYSYDNIVQTNFHLYVDNIPNYVVILKLKNGNMIGAYSQNALASMVGNKGPGFITSLTNEITTYIESKIQGARTTNYNQYYMIFGNDEFRFQPQKKEVTCLVGYQFSFYRPKICPKDLLGVQQETSEFVNYEVHKIIFDNDEQ